MTITLPDTQADALDKRALDRYDNELKPLLEPGENGRFVAIHAETGDYDTGRSSPEARRLLRKRYPHGYIITLRIGNEPEYALIARILAGEIAQGGVK